MALKAEVDGALALKANVLTNYLKVDVDTALILKASKTDVDMALASKANVLTNYSKTDFENYHHEHAVDSHDRQCAHFGLIGLFPGGVSILEAGR